MGEVPLVSLVKHKLCFLGESGIDEEYTPLFCIFSFSYHFDVKFIGITQRILGNIFTISII